MKSEGIVRNIDSVGRIVLPKDLRIRLGLDTENAAVEIYTEGEKIIFKKYAPACIFCDSADDIVVYKGNNICKECVKTLNQL
ncbi:MAG: Transition state regulatory protein AbrB [Firmicutes bacterium ADurb.Bin300]|nr:MAG: Transition state regulatory protein AbrB [Firmicutes bacterium ADurb.Bin300]HOD02364.1 AbrB/MazE/SpoVT family DNA-binding domain-containing protein [Clostridiales bacterium]